MYKEKNDDANYFDRLDLQLTGVIDYLGAPTSANNFGVIGLTVLSTNKSHLDERKNRRYYYCLIKNGRAELYQYGVNRCQIGDTILLNTKNGLFVTKRGLEINSLPILLYTNDRFWEFVQNHYQKF